MNFYFGIIHRFYYVAFAEDKCRSTANFVTAEAVLAQGGQITELKENVGMYNCDFRWRRVHSSEVKLYR